MGNLAFDPELTAREPKTAPAGRAFRIGGGLQDLPGAVPKSKHKLHRSNIEQEENEMIAERQRAGIFFKYPETLYKPGKLERQVMSDEEFDDAIAKGWKTAKQLHAGEVEELQTDAPDRINQMTVKQALAFIADHKTDAAKLVQMRADEQMGGNRKAVLDALAEAEDGFGFQGMNVRNATPKDAPKKQRGRPRKSA